MADGSAKAASGRLTSAALVQLRPAIGGVAGAMVERPAAALPEDGDETPQQQSEEAATATATKNGARRTMPTVSAALARSATRRRCWRGQQGFRRAELTLRGLRSADRRCRGSRGLSGCVRQADLDREPGPGRRHAACLLRVVEDDDTGRPAGPIVGAGGRPEQGTERRR